MTQEQKKKAIIYNYRPFEKYLVAFVERLKYLVYEDS